MHRIATALAALLISLPAQAADLAQMNEESRAAVQEFFAALKGELVAAIEQGGPPNAIGACNEKAPALAAAISARKGWRVARTSLKPRNPGNAPDAWESAVLRNFEARKAAGEDPAGIEFSALVDQAGGQAYRYMKAIPTAEKPCLACHGKQLSPEVSARLDALYPADQARGYRAGDLRGAFTITRTLR
ncbi:MAG TPA: DUF3365 domain-containing protein [Gammaproteobacteria bacterium]